MFFFKYRMALTSKPKTPCQASRSERAGTSPREPSDPEFRHPWGAGRPGCSYHFSSLTTDHRWWLWLFLCTFVHSASRTAHHQHTLEGTLRRSRSRWRPGRSLQERQQPGLRVTLRGSCHRRGQCRKAEHRHRKSLHPVPQFPHVKTKCIPPPC